MKLYTQEQVRKALRMTLGSLKISTENDIVNSLNPIYLPSDNDTQSSSIEWLIKQFETTEFYSEESKENVKEKAKAMHKKEIEDAELRGKEIIIIKHTEHGGGEQ
jgi:hypothetical protein